MFSNDARISLFHGCDTQLFRRKGDEPIDPRPAPHVHAHAHALPARRLIIEISHVERACLRSRSARAPCNVTSAWCIHAGSSIQSDLHKRKRDRALSPGSRRLPSPYISFELQDGSKIERKFIIFAMLHHHEDFKRKFVQNDIIFRAFVKLNNIIAGNSHSIWFTKCRVVTRHRQLPWKLFCISKWTVTLIDLLFRWPPLAENEGLSDSI